MKNWIRVCAVMSLLLFIRCGAVAAQNNAVPEMIGEREGTTWVVPLGSAREIKIPRVFASLKSAHFQGHPDAAVQIKSNLKHWTLRFKGEAKSDHAVLNFDTYPATLSEIKPINQLGDGTLSLPAALGMTSGTKLRFEPQPNKNTIGFWTKTSDLASWQINISKPGKFNVGLLQGAGKNGGGVAKISLLRGEELVDSIDYSPKVTGHFQNFIWQHAGALTASDAGEYILTVQASEITQTALMDVRQIHLSPARR